MRPTARVYAPFFPFPATEGAYHVVSDQLRVLSELGFQVELVVWKEAAGEVVRRMERVRPASLAGSLRVTLLVAEGLRTLTAEQWAERAGPGSVDGAGEGVAARLARVARAACTDLASPELFHYPPAADPRGRLPRADLGIYHYSFAYAWLRSRAERPEQTVAVHFHNLESELAHYRRRDSRGIGGRLAGAVHALNARKLARHESELSQLADELWFVSARDLADYAPRGTRAKPRLVPPTLPRELWEARADGFRARQEDTVALGFLGGCDFAPNRASLEWIVDRLAPELRRRGFGGRILVAGRGVPEALRARGDAYGFFQWLGFVPELDEFWSRLSLFLMPHVGGSGVRIKILEALASGVPVLANRAAVDPLSPDLRRAPLLLQLEEPAEWAERILSEARPFQTRTAVEPLDYHSSSLSGARVYEFLRGSPVRATS